MARFIWILLLLFLFLQLSKISPITIYSESRSWPELGALLCFQGQREDASSQRCRGWGACVGLCALIMQVCACLKEERQRHEKHRRSDGTGVCICCDQEAQDSILHFLLSSTSNRMFAIRWYFSSLASICNLYVILAVSCLFWEWSTPTMNIFSSEIPKRNVSIKKEMFLSHYESSQPINHQVHCARSDIFRNYNSNNIPSGLQIDIYLPLSHKNIKTSWSKLFEQNLLRINFALTLNLIGKLWVDVFCL